MTETLENRTKTVNGFTVESHTCTDELGIDCGLCARADNDGFMARRPAKAPKKFSARKRTESVVKSAREVSTITVNHTVPDLPGPQLFEFAKGEYQIQIQVNTNGTALLKVGDALCEVSAAAALASVEVFKKDAAVTGGPVKEFSSPSAVPPVESAAPVNTTGAAPAPLAERYYDAALAGPGGEEEEPSVGPAALSQATIAKGFILAGNAYFTIRSQKTGTRYTYRVNRAKCSRCGKLDCGCWAHPTYFVALLTGPDNTGDYTYLGMIRQEQFSLTRASKMQATSTPVRAFQWVWSALIAGEMPAQTEIWHEGRCGRCGRKLTVPESVERGIGPECAGKMGF